MKKYKLLKDLDNPFFKASVGNIHTIEEWLELFGYEKLSQFENIIEKNKDWFEEVFEKSPIDELIKKCITEIFLSDSENYKTTTERFENCLKEHIKNNGKEEIKELIMIGNHTNNSLEEILSNYIIIKTKND